MVQLLDGWKDLRLSKGLAVAYSSSFSSVLDFDLYVCCFDLTKLIGGELLYIHSSYFFYYCVLRVFYNICSEPRQNLGQGLLQRITGFSYHPSAPNNLLLTVPRCCVCCCLF